MNAGAYGGEMKDVVVETEYMDKDGEIRVVRMTDTNSDTGPALSRKIPA